MCDKINDMIKKFKKLDRKYYESCRLEDRVVGEGRSEIISIINELENLGVERKYLREIDDEIYCEIFEI